MDVENIKRIAKEYAPKELSAEKMADMVRYCTLCSQEIMKGRNMALIEARQAVMNAYESEK